ncbi:MAG: amidohydrolase [Chloroflexi bacterium]|nr:amidohydrolase [Chloroflexota bacterium]
MTDTVSITEHREATEVAVRLVDCDVHPVPRSYAELREYLPEPWRSRRFPERLFAGDKSTPYVTPQQLPGARADAQPPTGPNGSDPEFFAKQLFDDLGVDYAIMNPLTVPKMVNPEHEAIRAAATNSWQHEAWLNSKVNAHGRLRASITIPSGDNDLAIQEIEKWAGHSLFAHILINPYVGPPFGEPSYYPIWEVATRHDLPIGLHFSRSTGLALLTPVGFASYLVEHHSMYAIPYLNQLVSMVMEGVFEKFPTLRVVFIEGGSGWVGPLMWRLDRFWKEFRSELPWLKRAPSEYIKENVRISSQPIEEPPQHEDLVRMLKHMHAERILMFATDYPHWDGDYSPDQLFRGLPTAVQQKILCENALDFYRLPSTRRT